MGKLNYLLATLIFALLGLQINAQSAGDSCRADFERVSSTTNDLLTAGFRALPWDTSNNRPEQICWNFGDNSDTCIKYNPALSNNYFISHTYGVRGTYNVCVKILYQGGCLSYKCKLAEVGTTDSCKATFETLASTSTPFGKYFIAQPFNSQHKKPVRICWNFGDNSDTCIKYSTTYTGTYGAFHSYNDTGVYNVCVKILYDGNCESQYCASIVVNTPEPDSCHANFEKISAATSSPLRIYYRALPWHNNNKKPEQICWNFGDDRDTCIKYNPALSNNYAVAHTYEHTGTYNVCVKILYQGGCSSYECKSVQINGADSCRANFETLTSTNNSQGKYFVAQPWHNNDKKPVRVCWNFGDNSDTCIEYSTNHAGSYAIFHSYSHTGSYNVCIKIKYDGGCESYYCKVIQMDDADSCQADFETGLISSTSPDRHFTAVLLNNHEKKPAHVCWNFGDGKDTCISYPENYSGAYTTDHHYAHSDIYEVCVKINYYGGCEAKKCKSVSIPPVIDTCGVHLFEITSSAMSLVRGFYFNSLNNNRPIRICWNFGDGTDTCIYVESNTTEIPYIIKHLYPSPGVYKACIKVIFQNECSASDCHEVAIRPFSDICGGYYTDSLVNLNTYVFKGFSVHKPNDAVISYRWTFGDGSSGVGEQVTHTYTVAGVYRACLLINTEKGCETRICNDVRSAGVNQSTLQLSPNPVANLLHSLFYSAYNETATIKIMNSNGVVVKTYTRQAVVGLNTWEFDLTGLLPGSYSFVIQSPNQFVSDIFFKL